MVIGKACPSFERDEWQVGKEVLEQHEMCPRGVDGEVLESLRGRCKCLSHWNIHVNSKHYGVQELKSLTSNVIMLLIIKITISLL